MHRFSSTLPARFSNSYQLTTPYSSSSSHFHSHLHLYFSPSKTTKIRLLSFYQNSNLILNKNSSLKFVNFERNQLFKVQKINKLSKLNKLGNREVGLLGIKASQILLTCEFSTIGTTSTKELPKEAASKKSPSSIRQRLGLASSRFNKNNKRAGAGESKEGNKKIEEMTAVPKLERQLTSNFDKHIEFSNSELFHQEEEPNEEIINVEKISDEEDNEVFTVVDRTTKILRKSLGASSATGSSPKLEMFTGEATDIGGGHENQDRCSCFRTGNNNQHLVLAVYDGHGRELGELAAVVAKEFFEEQLKKPEVLSRVENDTVKTLEKLFEDAHLKIKERFKNVITSQGDWDVVEAPEGYLIKRQKVPRRMSRGGEDDGYMRIAETNVHGGTTATVVIILNGSRMIVANVGDSSAIFGGVSPNGSVIVHELSGEHSPEAIEEFHRVRRVFKADGSKMPDLRFVYDVIDRPPNVTPKHSCPSIFNVNEKTTVIKNERGFYYKNVRSEWATLVTTPPTARFQDALAFTRSLGDLHLHVYGVSHVPEIKEFDLTSLHKQIAGEDENMVTILLVCTDGVWDNWKYEDIISRVSTSPKTETALEDGNAQALTDEMMGDNIRLARSHFGNQADNMTGVVCVVHSVPSATHP